MPDNSILPKRKQAQPDYRVCAESTSRSETEPDRNRAETRISHSRPAAWMLENYDIPGQFEWINEGIAAVYEALKTDYGLPVSSVFRV
ncbi:MAG: hypothetical protein GKR97_20835 [Rhizobiaceae bacterium]|nr:hypothetical protein [Rhizobiaceae bacterium]